MNVSGCRQTIDREAMRAAPPHNVKQAHNVQKEARRLFPYIRRRAAEQARGVFMACKDRRKGHTDHEHAAKANKGRKQAEE